MHLVLHLVEPFVFFTVAGLGGFNVIAANVGGGPAQARYAQSGKIQAIGGLPGTLILAVKIGPVGVSQPDGVAAIANAALILIPAVVVAGAAAALLVSDLKRVNIPDIAGGQAQMLLLRPVSLASAYS